MLTVLDIAIWVKQNPTTVLMYEGRIDGEVATWDIRMWNLDKFTLNKTPLREVIESYKQEQST
jgi:hypothetical protein